eukprot:7122-Heterococcus_DN1.PRE.1
MPRKSSAASDLLAERELWYLRRFVPRIVMEDHIRTAAAAAAAAGEELPGTVAPLQQPLCSVFRAAVGLFDVSVWAYSSAVHGSYMQCMGACSTTPFARQSTPLHTVISLCAVTHGHYTAAPCAEVLLTAYYTTTAAACYCTLPVRTTSGFSTIADKLEKLELQREGGALPTGDTPDFNSFSGGASPVPSGSKRRASVLQQAVAMRRQSSVAILSGDIASMNSSSSSAGPPSPMALSRRQSFLT